MSVFANQLITDSASTYTGFGIYDISTIIVLQLSVFVPRARRKRYYFIRTPVRVYVKARLISYAKSRQRPLSSFGISRLSISLPLACLAGWNILNLYRVSLGSADGTVFVYKSLETSQTILVMRGGGQLFLVSVVNHCGLILVSQRRRELTGLGRTVRCWYKISSLPLSK